jgi:hypothetical protein
MAYFQPKNPNLVTFWRVLQWKMLVYFMAIWSILQPLGMYIFHPFGLFSGYLVSIFPFCIAYQEKSGNPANDPLLSTLKYVASRRQGCQIFLGPNIPKRE